MHAHIGILSVMWRQTIDVLYRNQIVYNHEIPFANTSNSVAIHCMKRYDIRSWCLADVSNIFSMLLADLIDLFLGSMHLL